MSLLTFFSLPRLRAVQRPCVAALRHNMSRRAGMEFFDELSAPTDSPPTPSPEPDLSNDTSSPEPSTWADSFEKDLPPAAPTGAWPPPNPPQPSAKTLLALRPVYQVHVQSTRNNTIMTVTRPDGSPIRIISGGSCGFKKSNRAGYEAGYKCATGAFVTLQDEQKKGIDLQWEMFLKGFGQGREAVQKALLSAEGLPVRDLLVRVTDKTPIKIGGTRAPKARRL